MTTRKDVEYWKGCLSRIKPDDVLARMLVLGKIKALSATDAMKKE
jgi:hypothetical protein